MTTTTKTKRILTMGEQRVRAAVDMARQLERARVRRRKVAAELRALDDDIRSLKRALREAEALEAEPGAVVTSHWIGAQS